MGEGKGLIRRLSDNLNNLEKNFDPTKSKKFEHFGKTIVVLTMAVISYYTGYGLGKLSDYICEKITNKNICEHISRINLPTEPEELFLYRDSLK